MAFDQAIRNRLARFVGEARALLSEEFTRQLQNDYGIDPVSGDVTPMERLSHLDDVKRETAQLLRDTMQHYLASADISTPAKTKKARQDVLNRIIREQAFTVLNRLCALRMSEARGLLLESIARGYQSKGFQLYQRMASVSLGETGDAYRMFLFSLFDEFSVELSVLFDRFSPQGRLFPRETALLNVLEQINHPDIDTLWIEDETIGWIYQYFNSSEERRQMRAESAAPRNSRELAVRNQFFTPRYVVEFLTDNTLGRLWYEMTKGKTSLATKCRYMVKRPNEVFLVFEGTKWPLEKDDWVKQVALSADFSKLPENPTISELERFALLIDGYGMAKQIEQPILDKNRETNDPVQHFIDRLLNPCLAELDHQDDIEWNGTSLELWCCLFFIQRKIWREGGRVSQNGNRNSILFSETEPKLVGLWNRLRRSLSMIQDNLTQEELLRQPVYIPHRPMKNPKDILMVDPACGSMHFGLYSFDLYEVIYTEYRDWHLGDDCDYEDKDIPKLIIENNIHGIDIDLRATQIAGLSLWLRAQRSWKEQGLRVQERPQIEKSNIVCAEPMPGEEDMLEEFVAQLQPKVLGQLVKNIFEKMKLAGEAGSLLKIEAEIHSSIDEAHKKYKEFVLQQKEDEGYIPGLAPKREPTLFDYMDLPQESDFWETAENRVIEAIRNYAEQASEKGNQKRLFAADAARGFAFIDICRKRYDVALMNPPFGDGSQNALLYLSKVYPEWTKNILAAFIIRALDIVSDYGSVGAIFDRTVSIKSSYEGVRKKYLIPNIRYIADTGWEVLDANVETTVHVLQKHSAFPFAECFDVRSISSSEKESALHENICKLFTGSYQKKTFTVNPNIFFTLPNAVIGYDFESFLLRAFSNMPSLETSGFQAREGHNLLSDWHFRLFYEISKQESIAPFSSYSLLYNGGKYSLFIEPLRDISLYGKNQLLVKYNSSVTLRNDAYHYKSGVCFGKRGDILDAHLFYKDVLFSSEGKGIPDLNQNESFCCLSYLNSSLAQYSINQYCGQHKHVGYINLLPYPLGDKHIAEEPIEIAKEVVKLKLKWQRWDETTLHFNSDIFKLVLGNGTEGIIDALQGLQKDYEKDQHRLYELIQQNDKIWEDYAGLNETDRKVLKDFTRLRPEDSPWPDANDEINSDGFRKMMVKKCISYIIGQIFGRFIGEVPEISSDIFVPPMQLRAWNLGDGSNSLRQFFVIENGEINELYDAALTRLETSGYNSSAADILAGCLGFEHLGTYFEQTNGFFDDHLRLYSKSRRNAPLYWPLSTTSGHFTIWLYYHDLTSQTLYYCVNDIVEPRIKQLNEELDILRLQSNRSSLEERVLENRNSLLLELIEYRDEMLKLATIWKPNQNDGVEITAAPLWKFFRHRQWQARLKETWEKLEAGEYDWAHLALSIWPDRVVRASHKDHSYAIAHDLEDALWEEVEVTRRLRGGREEKTKEWRPRELTDTDICKIVEDVKAR